MISIPSSFFTNSTHISFYSHSKSLYIFTHSTHLTIFHYNEKGVNKIEKAIKPIQILPTSYNGILRVYIVTTKTILVYETADFILKRRINRSFFYKKESFLVQDGNLVYTSRDVYVVTPEYTINIYYSSFFSTITPLQAGSFSTILYSVNSVYYLRNRSKILWKGKEKNVILKDAHLFVIDSNLVNVYEIGEVLVYKKVIDIGMVLNDLFKDVYYENEVLILMGESYVYLDGIVFEMSVEKICVWGDVVWLWNECKVFYYNLKDAGAGVINAKEEYGKLDEMVAYVVYKRMVRYCSEIESAFCVKNKEEDKMKRTDEIDDRKNSEYENISEEENKFTEIIREKNNKFSDSHINVKEPEINEDKKKRNSSEWIREENNKISDSHINVKEPEINEDKKKRNSSELIREEKNKFSDGYINVREPEEIDEDKIKRYQSEWIREEKKNFFDSDINVRDPEINEDKKKRSKPKGIINNAQINNENTKDKKYKISLSQNIEDEKKKYLDGEILNDKNTLIDSENNRNREINFSNKQKIFIDKDSFNQINIVPDSLYLYQTFLQYPQKSFHFFKSLSFNPFFILNSPRSFIISLLTPSLLSSLSKYKLIPLKNPTSLYFYYKGKHEYPKIDSFLKCKDHIHKVVKFLFRRNKLTDILIILKNQPITKKTAIFVLKHENIAKLVSKEILIQCLSFYNKKSIDSSIRKYLVKSLNGQYGDLKNLKHFTGLVLEEKDYLYEGLEFMREKGKRIYKICYERSKSVGKKERIRLLEMAVDNIGEDIIICKEGFVDRNRLIQMINKINVVETE